MAKQDDCEIRKILLTNNSDEEKIIQVTSYCEVSLAPYSNDICHPIFENLFIETEFIGDPKCLLANRRAKPDEKKGLYSFCTVATDGQEVSTLEYETNRDNFIGRGRDLKSPKVLDEGYVLKGYSGFPLEPIFSLRIVVKIPPRGSNSVVYIHGISDTKEESIEIARKFSNMDNINRAFQFSYIKTKLFMKQFPLKKEEANLYQKIGSRMIYAGALRCRENYILKLSRGESLLMALGLEKTLPILIMTIDNLKELNSCNEILRAYNYLNIKGLMMNLVIDIQVKVNEIEEAKALVSKLIDDNYLKERIGAKGGIFIFDATTIKNEDLENLKALAMLVFNNSGISIEEQLNKLRYVYRTCEKANFISKTYEYKKNEIKADDTALKFFNDLGGFDVENKEYVILLKDKITTPAPWCNIIANKNFGFVTTESGISYTWHKNSRQNKLTNWHNDIIIDGESEHVYLRDEENGAIWSISPKPIRDDGLYKIRHGFGYSVFEHEAQGILSEMTVFTPTNMNVKVFSIKMKNLTSENRVLSCSYYARLSMGVAPELNSRYISTYINNEKQYIYAKNPYNEGFEKLLCYVKAIGSGNVSFTGNRTEFIGQGKCIESPEALSRVGLSNTVGAGYDPCLALNSKIRISARGEETFIILLGEEEDINQINATIEEASKNDFVSVKLKEVKDYWKSLMSQVEIKTPSESMNIMMNGWLMYQIVSCRLFARSTFYQSSGAYGFRDQLQDVLSTVFYKPEFTREHILFSASKQFKEGDVQHWWHEGLNLGLRSKFTDDLLWLVFVTCDYVKRTGDYGILEEEVNYLEAEQLKSDENQSNNPAKVSGFKESIYNHCIRAIEKSLRFGVHNIPLINGGDWNDGFNRIGINGKGESVWNGWFIYKILKDFIGICEYKKDEERAKKYEDIKIFIGESIEKNAWDGEWYKRAFFDDGTPLGSKINEECRIDSITQSWAVICGGANKDRVDTCIKSVYSNLVKKNKKLVLMLTPPLAKSRLEPGIIKSYISGVRENGGQYTHAAVWFAYALAMLGRGEEAFEIFDIINPINHSRTFFEAANYRVEPYVTVADVYSMQPYEGRGRLDLVYWFCKLVIQNWYRGHLGFEVTG